MEKIFDLTQIKTGDNLLVSSHSWLAKKIQQFQKVKWNHSGMFWIAYGEVFVIEADRYGIACTPFSDYIKGKSHLMILKPQFAVDGSEYGKFMLPYCGKHPYDFFNLLIAQPIKFITNGRLWIGNNKNTPKRFICGQWTEFVYHHFYPEYFENWKECAPSDIYASPLFKHYLFER